MLIIKLGGSLILNNLTEFNPKISSFLEKLRLLEQKTVITVGGGKTCRFYQKELKEQGIDSARELNWMGISSVLLNAQYIKALLSKSKTYPRVIDSADELTLALQKIELYDFFITGAWEINHSSDYDAVEMAINFGSDKVLRLSDVDFVFDNDPDINSKAKPIERITWDKYINDILGKDTQFISGGSYPVDPIAARLASRSNISFYFMSLESFLNMKELNFKDFKGTIIE
jgi:uridylate kinase